MTQEQGKVWLVGAGPGDPGLFTVKGEQVLRNAEVVLYDNLIGSGVLSLIPPRAEALYVGKQAGRHVLSQGKINELLARKAREGKRVVRLKGGDPFLFGRGGEEAEALAQDNIPFEVIPGVSAAVAVPEYFGIPLTHRDCASLAHLVTAHGKDEQLPPINWRALVQAGGTLVIFMGLSQVREVCENLMEAGMPPETPAAVLEQGTTARQKKLAATLGKLAAEARKRDCRPPALIVVGEVCAYSEKLSWFEKRPLSSLRIGVTRPRERAGELSAMLSGAGAEVIQIPVIQTRIIAETPLLKRALDDSIAADKSGADWFVFTSPAGVEALFEKLKKYRFDIRALAGVKFAAIGKKTASALENRGIMVDLVPEHFSGRDLSRALEQELRPGDRAILLRSSRGNDFIVHSLRAAGLTCFDIPLYETLKASQSGDACREYQAADLDCCVFTSGSTVEGYAELFGTHIMKELKAFCIGEETALAAEKYGAKTWIARNATMDALVQTIIDAKNGGLL